MNMVYARPECGVPQDELCRISCEGCDKKEGCRAWTRGGVFYEETVDDIVREMQDPAQVHAFRMGVAGGVGLNSLCSAETVVSMYASRITDALNLERSRHSTELTVANKERERIESEMRTIAEVDISAAKNFDFTDGCGGEDFGDVSMYCMVDDGYCGHNQITDDVRDAVLRGFTAVQEFQYRKEREETEQ